MVKNLNILTKNVLWAAAAPPSVVLQDAIQNAGYQLHIAENESKAILLIAKTEIFLAICDNKSSGIRVIQTLVEAQPDAGKIIIEDPEGTTPEDFKDECLVIRPPLTVESFPQALVLARLAQQNKALNKQLLQQQAVVARLEHHLNFETELGNKIYHHLLLGKLSESILSLDIATTSVPDDKIRGNYYDFFQPNKRHFDLVLTYFSSKGLGGVLLSAIIKAHLIRFAIPATRTQNLTEHKTWDDDLFAPNEILSNLHHHLSQYLADLSYFAHIIYARFDIVKRQLHYTNCGVVSPIHCSATKIEPLKLHTSPLGSHEGPRFSLTTVSYQPFDTFIFYSPEILEVKSSQGEAYGVERFINKLHSAKNLSASEIIKSIRQDVARFTQSITLQEEYTIIVIKINDQALPETHRSHLAKFIADFSQLQAVRDFVARICNDAPGDSESLSEQMQLAINEIFCNIVEHGLGNDGRGEIIVQAELGPSGIHFDITDQGPSFDPQKVKEPSLAGDRDEGFGWYLVKKVVDKIVYTHKKSKNGWNHTKLYKAYLGEKRPMELTHELINEVLVITPKSGTIDAKEVPKFKASIKDIVQNDNPTGTAKVVLDLEYVEFIDSSGLGTFLSLLRDLKQNGGTLKLANLRRSVRTIFELVSMNKAFEIYDSTTEAVKSFK